MELQPLVWHQFKVLAANQYTTSLFSIPGKLEFAELRRPGPPREFRVLSTRTVKGHAEVDISWRKPESINGRIQYDSFFSLHFGQCVELLEADTG